MIGGFVVLVIVSAATGGNDSSKNSSSNDTATQAAQKNSVKTVTQAAPAQPTPEPTAPRPRGAARPGQPEMTAGQENAVQAGRTTSTYGVLKGGPHRATVVFGRRWFLEG